ncbi:MAG: pantoate--beta-alanine ligase [Bacteroidetes bacterium]|nr:pantoate--beta-alanine ligase [Bacteroidota bacterium]
MKVVTKISEMTKAMLEEHRAGNSIGFVPTMGALHAGHLSLVEKSRKSNRITVCSIFVNPIQFNNKKDLEKYPRNLKEDLGLLDAAGCDYVFTPETGEIYPAGMPVLDIKFGTLDKVLEGKFRPGHFKGVAIIVKKLFEIISPDHAYFGLKDYQQLLVIRHLVSVLKLPVQIHSCPTFREPDGLAMSSRNLRLTIGEREMASLIYETLCKVKKKAGHLPVKELRQWAIKKINSNPAFSVEYFEIVNKYDLHSLQSWREKENALAVTAVFLGDVRLIDNMELFS